MFIDFMGDKAGARLSYGGKFEIYDGETLETITPEYDIPNVTEKRVLDTLEDVNKYLYNEKEGLLPIANNKELLYNSKNIIDFWKK